MALTVYMARCPLGGKFRRPDGSDVYELAVGDLLAFDLSVEVEAMNVRKMLSRRWIALHKPEPAKPAPKAEEVTDGDS